MDQSLQRFGFQAMGGFCEVQIYDSSRVDAKRLSQQLAAEVVRLERKYSRYRTDSVLSDINFSAGAKLGIKIDTETRALFEHAQSCYEQSGGLFDITSGILGRVWDFKTGRVPEQEAIDKLLPRIGFDRLKWNRSRLYLPHGMEIDFGGIVKEYAADAVAGRGRDLGIKHGLVNLGGDFAVIGPQPDDEPWQVGVVNPKDPKSLLAKIPLSAGGLASSGDYERCLILEGRRYSHILNPKTGWPCSGLRAASVAADLCTVAGSMATIAMLKEEAEGIRWLDASTLPHVYMTADETIAGPTLKSEVA